MPARNLFVGIDVRLFFHAGNCHVESWWRHVRALIRIAEGVANDRCCNVSVLRYLRKDSVSLALEMALNTLEPLVNRILHCKNYFNKKHNFAQITDHFILFSFPWHSTLCRNCISHHCRWSSHCGEHIASFWSHSQTMFYLLGEQ